MLRSKPYNQITTFINYNINMDDFNYKQTIKDLEEEINSLEDTAIDKDSKIVSLESEIDQLKSNPDFEETLARVFDDYCLELCEGGQFLFRRYAEDILDRIKTGSYDYIL
jgi:cellulose biosynthesis protein BcsQ